MIANLALGFVLLAVLLAAPANALEDSEEYLSIVEINEVADEDGFITFVGTIHNAHPRLLASLPEIILTVKKDGIIIDLVRGFCLESLGPGETCEFSAKTEHTQEGYDEVTGRLTSSLLYAPDPDPDRLTGELLLVEKSLNIRSAGDGWTLILGELFNGTNAVLDRVVVAFALYDANDNFLGWAEPMDDFFAFGIYLENLWPNETIPFVVGTEDVPFAKVERWEVGIRYSIDYYPDFTVPTLATRTTWGQIKQQRGGRE